MIRVALFAVYIAFFAMPASAKSVGTPADMRKATDQIMTQVGAGNVDAGFKLMKPLTIIPEAEFDSMVGRAKLQLPMMLQRFGESLGYEFISEDKVGENLIRYIYAQRFENHAMRWIFYIYRGKSGWLINSFQFDDKLPAFFPQ